MGQDDMMLTGLSLLWCRGVWKGPELGEYAKLEPVWQKWDRSVRQPFLLTGKIEGVIVVLVFTV